MVKSWPSAVQQDRVPCIQWIQSFVLVFMNTLRKKVLRWTSSTVIWNVNFTGNDLSFVDMVQFHRDKPVTSLKAKAVIAYSFQITSLTYTHELRLLLIGYGYTFPGRSLYQQLILIRASQSKCWTSFLKHRIPMSIGQMLCVLVWKVTHENWNWIRFT